MDGSLTVYGELTADNRHIVLMAAGDDFSIRRAARWLGRLTPAMKKSDPPGALLAPLTWAATVQLAHAFGSAWTPGPRLVEWVTAEMVRRTATGVGLSMRPPEGFVPRQYQVDGALMIAATGRALLFDEAGSGKTITTILGLAERYAQGKPTLPVVVIAPASVVDPWVEAWHNWCPQWKTVAWRGVPKVRHALAHTADVYVTSYDTARMDSDDKGPLRLLGARSLVIDECHLIKSRYAARSVASRRLAKQAEAFVALSGTPITHHPGDLWPTLEALSPLSWPAHEPWVERYCWMVPGDNGTKILGLAPQFEPEFRATLLGQHRRVAKADVLTQLPPKVYSVRNVDLPPEYRRAYDEMEQNMITELPDGGELSVVSALAQLTRLSQMASAPADLTVTQEQDAQGMLVDHVAVRLKAPSWKVSALLEVLEERPDSQVVAFAPSRQLVMLAGQQATAAGLSVGYVVGGQSMSERTETVQAFQAGKLNLLCATTGAGGVGLTLTAAKTVVFLQRPWSYVEASQSEDRCHRLGSEIHDCIEIIDIVATDTIDSRVRAVLHDKAGQLAKLLQDRRILTQLLGGKNLGKAA